jgi:hypothetical protein
MATKQPQGLRQKVRLPLIGAYSNRSSDSSKDQKFVNAFPETRKVEQLENTRIYINKRPGLTEVSNVTGPAVGRGFIWFYNFFYAIIGNTVYKVSNDGLTITTAITLPSSTGACGVLSCNSASIGDYVFICDGTVGWIIKSDHTYTQIVDPDFPSPHVPTPAFIDGYVLLAKGSDVFNCNLDDPLSWQVDQYLSAEMFPDPIVALARQNNQVVVLGESSTEFFYDAANASGSPLSRNDAGVIQFGCAASNAIYQNEQFCIWIGQSGSGGRAVWQLEGFKPKKVSDEFIDRILDAETNLEDCHGYGFRTMGHLFFLINLPFQHRTLVYDLDEKLWHEWSSWTEAREQEVFLYNHVADSNDGYVYLLSSITGDIYKLLPNVYQDENDPIIVEIRTNKYDMDTYNRKFGSVVRIVGDRYSTTNNVSLSWTDSDYQSYSTPVDIDMSDDYPAFQRLGSFRRRAWKLKHIANQPLRLESLELIYDEGTS